MVHIPAPQPLQVLVNAHRSDGKGVSLDVLMQPHCEVIAKQQGVGHFDLLEYGQGRKLAAAALAKALASEGPEVLFPDGVVLVSTRSLHHDHCFPLLEALAGVVVVRGGGR